MRPALRADFPRGEKCFMISTRETHPNERPWIPEAIFMLTGRATRLALVLVLLALALVPAWPQTTGGTVKGVIVDKDGNPLPGVTVTLENPSMAVTGLGGVTNAQGEFRITPVPPGKGYILRASMPSFQKLEITVDVPSGKTVVQNVTLRPALTERLK